MALSYFAVMLMFATSSFFFFFFFWCYVKKRNKFLKTDFLLPALECLNGRMDETLCFSLLEKKVKFLIMSDVSTPQYFCKKSDCN